MEGAQSVRQLPYTSELDPQQPYFKKLGLVAVCTCNLKAGREKAGGSPGLAVQRVKPM